MSIEEDVKALQLALADVPPEQWEACGFDVRTIRTDAGGGFAVADCTNSPRSGDDTSALARFIAAANPDRIARLLSALEEAEKASGWVPIEQAPKDGTELLLWREDCGQFIGSYTSADSFPLTQQEIDAFDDDTLFSKDWFTQWPQAMRLEGSETPTHFRALPPAPALAGR